MGSNGYVIHLHSSNTCQVESRINVIFHVSMKTSQRCYPETSNKRKAIGQKSAICLAASVLPQARYGFP